MIEFRKGECAVRLRKRYIVFAALALVCILTAVLTRKPLYAFSLGQDVMIHFEPPETEQGGNSDGMRHILLDAEQKKVLRSLCSEKVWYVGKRMGVFLFSGEEASGETAVLTVAGQAGHIILSSDGVIRHAEKDRYALFSPVENRKKCAALYEKIYGLIAEEVQ